MSATTFDGKDPPSLPVPDPANLDYCMQAQIRYSCGHSTGGEFIKCRRHINKEDERCSNRSIIHIDGKHSPHKCRSCLRSA
ncbi:hypothetical protein NUU61_002095 [Penicillium alfredii]|uniref:Uncharacterized protein n=1 Tax=Penicillium alfredii TaxID=1506179 RepID=A0A9W9FR25_9EURO|nr:uncharacterized protein NUU61_002095 [Penicillium alfredii]KAJ5104748.1 hypothetical protein NUU61_002095 [Penicillium alfredii]